MAAFSDVPHKRLFSRRHQRGNNVKSWLIYIPLQAVQPNNFPVRADALTRPNKDMEVISDS